ncbi:MAG: hypothetical protein ACYTGX_08645 [Planctomycetota bacterium]
MRSASQGGAGDGRRFMSSELLVVLATLGGWLLLQLVILPKLGVET